MSETAAGFLHIALLVAALAACYRPLGAYMARAYTSEHDNRVELFLYRLMGVDSKAEQRWPVYARSLLAFCVVSMLFLYGLLRLQSHLPLSLGFPEVPPDQAFNTAASSLTNTNWQSYSGESTMGHLAQMAGLAVENFTSAAVGMAVAVALIRGFIRSGPIVRPRPPDQPRLRRGADRPHRPCARTEPSRGPGTGRPEHPGPHARVPRRTTRQRPQPQPGSGLARPTMTELVQDE